MQPLPIDSEIPKILAELKASGNLVLVASPGAGKTTRVPAAILNSSVLDPKVKGIILLEPRRLAARAAAARIAEENQWQLGAEVGYQVRFENRSSAQTQLLVMTEGLLSRKLVQDPELTGIGCVILDEFHERSWHSDIGLGLLRELQQLSRTDLKIVVMSATLQADKVADYLGGCPIVNVGAKAHPISLHHQKEPQLLVTGPEFTNRVSTLVESILFSEKESHGDILVFMPGVREIMSLSDRVESAAKKSKTDIHILHGSLKLEEQARAIRRGENRKLVISTNIAETSLTIDGVRTVVDTGLARVNRQDSNGFPKLELSRISQFSAIQRMGRAGRQGPGVCYRMWNKFDEASMPETETPEIKRIDLAEAALLLSVHGIRDWHRFSWFEKPLPANLNSAQSLLEILGAIKIESGLPKLTELGRALLAWPLHPRLSRIMEAAAVSQQSAATAAKLVALISERDILRDPSSFVRQTDSESDIQLRLDLLDSNHPALDRYAVTSVLRAAEQIEKIAERKISRKQELKNERLDLPALLLLGFPDRVCRRRRPNAPEARMVGGKGVRLHPNSCVTRAELFVAIDAVTLSSPTTKNDASVTLAIKVEASNLEKLFPNQVRERREPKLDETSGKVLMQIAHYYHDLAIEEPRTAPANQQDVMRILPDIVASSWQAILERNEKIRAWKERFEFLQSALPSEPWPKHALTDADQPEIRALIETITVGEKSPTVFFEKDFRWALNDWLGSQLARLMETEAPESIQVPSGSRIQLHYPPPPRQPFIEVRLQEVFGWAKGPSLARGTVPIVLHLLGPNYRPVQVTQDLQSFWAGSYSEVRKELKARYPKHSWPDDPMQAKPEAKGRPRK